MCPAASLNIVALTIASLPASALQLENIEPSAAISVAFKQQNACGLHPTLHPGRQGAGARCPGCCQRALACENIHHVVTEAGTRGSGSQTGDSIVAYARDCACANNAPGMIGSRRMHPLTRPCSADDSTSDDLLACRLPLEGSHHGMHPSVCARVFRFARLILARCCHTGAGAGRFNASSWSALAANVLCCIQQLCAAEAKPGEFQRATPSQCHRLKSSSCPSLHIKARPTASQLPVLTDCAAGSRGGITGAGQVAERRCEGGQN